MIYYIILLIIIIAFICYNMHFKNKPNTNINLQKNMNLSNDNIKKNYNYVEFFENPPNQKCNKYTRDFNNIKDKLLMDLNKFKGVDNEIRNINTKLSQAHNDMIDLCNNPNNECEIKNFANLCIGVDEGPDFCSLTNTKNSDGSFQMQYRTIETDSWENLEMENDFIRENSNIQLFEHSYIIKEPKNFIFQYKSKYNHKFTDWILAKESVILGLPDFYSVESKNLTSDKNGTVEEHLKKILMCIYQVKEISSGILTEEDIKSMKEELKDDIKDEKSKKDNFDYIIQKWTDIKDRFELMTPNDIKNEIRNNTTALEVLVTKNIWNYCKFKKDPTDDTPRDIQDKINDNKYTHHITKSIDSRKIKIECEKNNGEFVIIPFEGDKQYFCIDKNNFKNPKINYIIQYLDENDKMINKAETKDDEEYNTLIKGKQSVKTAINSCDRLLGLEYDYIAKKCAEKYEGHGCIGSSFDVSSNEFSTGICYNSNYDIEKDNRAEVTNEFYIIDKDQKFIKTIKSFLINEDEEDTMTNIEYDNIIKENTICYEHTHVKTDGTSITHKHKINKESEDKDKHEHTDKELENHKNNC